MLLYSATELGSVFRQGGFKAVEFFGSLAGAQYDHDAERLVALATK